MSQKVLLLHGWGGSDYPHWQSWLAGEIAKDYGTVSFLEFSNFEFPSFSAWKQELITHLEDFKPDIVICHSLANTLWFHLCNANAIEKVQKLYLIAPPSIKCDVAELESFFPLDMPKNAYAKETLLITSTNDPYMSMDEAKELQNSLGVEMIVLENAGHINTDSGYGEWPWILEKIKEDLKND